MATSVVSGSTLELAAAGGRMPGRESVADVEFRTPSELAALAEMLFRGVFGSGLIVSCLFTAYATVLAFLQPGSPVIGMITCGALLAAELLLVWKRRVAYELLRRRPTAILVAALIVACGGWMSGVHNDQYFFILTLLIGVLGVAVSFRLTVLAAVVAALGVAAPAIIDGGSAANALFAALVPPIFWLVVNRLAVFVLGLHRVLTLQPMAISTERPRSARTHRRGNAEHQDRPQRKRQAQIPERAFSLHDWATQLVRIRRVFKKSDVPLTARQQQAVFYCCDGLDDAEVAEAMSISVRQVRRYLAEARDRTGSATREQLAAWAVGLGLIP